MIDKLLPCRVPFPLYHIQSLIEKKLVKAFFHEFTFENVKLSW